MIKETEKEKKGKKKGNKKNKKIKRQCVLAIMNVVVAVCYYNVLFLIYYTRLVFKPAIYGKISQPDVATGRATVHQTVPTAIRSLAYPTYVTLSDCLDKIKSFEKKL